MKKSTHSKIKNTVILFELLSRQIAADTIQGKENSPAISIIKKFFNASSALSKELTLYQTLINESYKTTGKANYLVSAVLSARKQLDVKQLKEQKYNLIKEIKAHYNLEDFFKTPISEYKLYASIYRVFEGANVVNPTELVNSRYTIVEHLTNNKKPKHTQNSDQLVLNEYAKQEESVRLLAYRLLVDKFNEKYSGLSESQKGVLKEYINNVSNTTTLKNYVLQEASLLKSELQKQVGLTKDKVLRIKLTEVVNLLGKFGKVKTVTENHILSLLLYYELQKELQTANKRTKG